MLASPKYYSQDFLENFHLSFHRILIGTCNWLQDAEKECTLTFNDSGFGGFFTSKIELKSLQKLFF